MLFNSRSRLNSFLSPVLIMRVLFFPILITIVDQARGDTGNYWKLFWTPNYVEGDILLTTHWSQHGDNEVYKLMTPCYRDSNDNTINHCRLGCWSTAIAQILNYHQLQSRGQVNYTCTYTGLLPSNTINNNLDYHVYHWSLMFDKVTSDSSEAVIENVAKFNYDVATVIQKDFGYRGYDPGYMTLSGSKNEYDMIAELIDHFEYLSANTYWDPTLTESDIKGEINHYRPIMFYMLGHKTGGSKTSYADVLDGDKTAHAVVIDGYRYDQDTFKVHLNYGLGGKNDGWYDYYGVFPWDSTASFDVTDHRKGMLIWTKDRTPYILKNDAMKQVLNMKTGGSVIDGWIDYAAEAIDQSLNNDYWIGDWKIEPEYGSKFVFYWESRAAAVLKAINKTSGIYFGKVLIKLVYADRLLVDAEMNDAENTTVSLPQNQPLVDELLRRAADQVNQAEDKSEIDDYELAIWHYKNAWKYAHKALQYAGLTSIATVDITRIIDEIENQDWNLLVPTSLDLLKNRNEAESMERIPKIFALYQNHPNPFNPETRLAYQLPEASQVTIKIYNILGQEAVTLVNQMQPGGEFKVTWNGRNSSGTDVPSGTYFCVMKAVGQETQQEFAVKIKMLLLR